MRVEGSSSPTPPAHGTDRISGDAMPAAPVDRQTLCANTLASRPNPMDQRKQNSAMGVAFIVAGIFLVKIARTGNVCSQIQNLFYRSNWAKENCVKFVNNVIMLEDFQASVGLPVGPMDSAPEDICRSYSANLPEGRNVWWSRCWQVQLFGARSNHANSLNII